MTATSPSADRRIYSCNAGRTISGRGALRRDLGGAAGSGRSPRGAGLAPERLAQVSASGDLQTLAQGPARRSVPRGGSAVYGLSACSTASALASTSASAERTAENLLAPVLPPPAGKDRLATWTTSGARAGQQVSRFLRRDRLRRAARQGTSGSASMGPQIVRGIVLLPRASAGERRNMHEGSTATDSLMYSNDKRVWW